MTKLGVGIVGKNWAARGHLPAWRMLPERCAPVAICTTNLETAEPAARDLGLPKAYGDFDAMLADPEIAIVSLGGPPPARTEMTLKALAAGKHVFSCIPFAVSASDAHRMADAAAARGLSEPSTPISCGPPATAISGSWSTMVFWATSTR